jgi:hypothetical protein
LLGNMGFGGRDLEEVSPVSSQDLSLH